MDDRSPHRRPKVGLTAAGNAGHHAATFMRTLWLRGALAALFFCVCAAHTAGANDRTQGYSASDLASASLSECEAGRRATERDAREQHFKHGQSLGERAVGIDDKSAEAHFAVFCNMGELMRLDGESISSVLQLRKLMAELDRALALKPDYYEAMTAKGTLLMRLPRLLGGDPVKGEAMLRTVAENDPTAFTSRLTLAKFCNARGDHDEALSLATRALQVAREQGRADKVAEAQATLAELKSAH
jgi:tetratricopeptide (TPR) repeat protein